MPEQRGCLIYVCGPSGAGKDALLRHAREALEPRGFVFPLRIITRPSDQSEKHIEMSAAEFAAAAQAGRFCMQWTSHGLYYALPANVRDDLAAGRAVVVNGSREYLATARHDFPQLSSVLITVPHALLETRLASRGREDGDAIVQRLARNQMLAECEADASHENSGDLAASSAAFVKLLIELAAHRGVRLGPKAA
jgi:ribose 1,5-bisphosphokinase